MIVAPAARVSKEALHQAAHILLNSDLAGEWYTAVHTLHSHYSAVTGIDAFPSEEQAIKTPTGRAIPINSAAFCLVEPKRTAIFLRGVYRALTELGARVAGRPLRVVYAGCGPYASLVSPMLHLFEAENLRLELIDINAKSLECVEALYAELGFGRFVDRTVQADAATLRLDDAPGVDLVISETLNNSLTNEPFVSIVGNLVPQLRDDAFFIPRRVTVDVRLSGAGGKWIDIARIAEVGRSRFARPESGTFSIPVTAWPADRLQTITRVEVFGPEVLCDLDTSLTVPRAIKIRDLQAGDEIGFEYLINERPGFIFSRR